MIRCPRWFASWLRAWPRSARQSREPVHLEAALVEVREAIASRDLKRQRRAFERARRERTVALARELGMEAFLQ